MKIKVVSFDMDGTLVSHMFNNYFWDEDIPRLYADKHHANLKQAKKFVFSEYKRFEGRIEWYTPEFWFKIYGFKEDYREVIRKNKDKLEIYQGAIEVLENLKKKELRLVMYSVAHIAFIIPKLEVIGNYFDKERVFSSVSDFRLIKKEAVTYKNICRNLGINTDELFHVGDSKNSDYLEPRAAKVNAYLLNRDGKYSESELAKIKKAGILKSLDEIFLRLR